MTRVLDDRGRLFGKVNIVDIVVLLVILAIVVFAVLRLSGDDKVAPATVPVKVTFVETRVNNALAAGMQKKGTVTDTAGNIIGDIQSTQSAPSVDELLTYDGQYKTFQSSTRSDVTFVVLGQGTVFDSTVHVGPLTARVGTDVRILGPGFEVQTTISDVVWGPEALK